MVFKPTQPMFSVVIYHLFCRETYYEIEVLGRDGPWRFVRWVNCPFDPNEWIHVRSIL